MLLGFHFAERLVPSGPERESVRLAVFLKFEQLAGYARYMRNKDGQMRGITEIKRRIDAEGGRRVSIGAARDLQILSNQKTYGLWGLYTMPSTDSGLLQRQDLVLTPLGQELVDKEYLPILRRHGLGDGEAVQAVLLKERADLEPEGRHAKVFDAVAAIMAQRIQKREGAIYHDSLVGGGPNGLKTWQPRFAELIERHLPDTDPFDAKSLERVITVASGNSNDAPLADHLQRIRKLEAVLVAMANLFGFLQDRDRAQFKDVETQIAKQWPKGLRHIDADAIDSMRGEIAKVYDDNPTGQRFAAFAAALRSGEYGDALTLVLDHNRFVMDARHKAQPWIILNGKKLEVRYRDESQIRLAEPKDLATAWRNGFYLNPLKQVSDELRKSA